MNVSLPPMKPLVHPAHGGGQGGDDDAELDEEGHAAAFGGLELVQGFTLRRAQGLFAEHAFGSGQHVFRGQALATDRVRGGHDGAFQGVDFFLKNAGTTLDLFQLGRALLDGQVVNRFRTAGCDALVHGFREVS